MYRALYKRIKTDDGFTDEKHHSVSWKNSKKLRQRNRRRKLKDISDKFNLDIFGEELTDEEFEKQCKLFSEEDQP